MALSSALVVGTVIVGVGLLLHIVGMATTHWIDADYGQGDKGSIGLFQACDETTCTDIAYLRSQDRAVQAMAILGVLAGCGGVLGTLVFVTLTYAGKNPMSLMRLASGALCIAAAVFIFICVIVYGAKIYKDVHDQAPDNLSIGYSFGLSTAGGVVLLLGAFVIVAKRGSPDERFTS